MAEDSGLVFGWVLDGSGGGRPVDWGGVRAWTPESGSLWIHLDLTRDSSRDWLTSESGLEPLVIEALMAQETRPRMVNTGEGLLVILRGVNLNPGADPEDMVSLRLWIDKRRVISVRLRTVMAIADLDGRIEAGRGPRGSSEFLAELAARLVDRMAPVIEDLDDRTDALEDRLLGGESREIRLALRDIRRAAISLRRYLAPQRDAMARLSAEDVSWIDPRLRARLRETTDRVIRYVEDLDEVRERAAVVQDELMNRLSEQMNRNMFVLSLVAGVMLPLGFLTGLLGINVGGIPGTDSSSAFAIVCVVLGVIAVVEVIILRRLNWF